MQPEDYIDPEARARMEIDKQLVLHEPSEPDWRIVNRTRRVERGSISLGRYKVGPTDCQLSRVRSKPGRFVRS